MRKPERTRLRYSPITRVVAEIAGGALVLTVGGVAGYSLAGHSSANNGGATPVEHRLDLSELPVGVAALDLSRLCVGLSTKAGTTLRSTMSEGRLSASSTTCSVTERGGMVIRLLAAENTVDGHIEDILREVGHSDNGQESTWEYSSTFPTAAPTGPMTISGAVIQRGAHQERVAVCPPTSSYSPDNAAFWGCGANTVDGKPARPDVSPAYPSLLQSFENILS